MLSAQTGLLVGGIFDLSTYDCFVCFGIPIALGCLLWLVASHNLLAERTWIAGLLGMGGVVCCLQVIAYYLDGFSVWPERVFFRYQWAALLVGSAACVEFDAQRPVWLVGLLRLITVAVAAWILMPRGDGWDQLTPLSVNTWWAIVVANGLLTWSAVSWSYQRHSKHTASWLLGLVLIGLAIVAYQSFPSLTLIFLSTGAMVWTVSAFSLVKPIPNLILGTIPGLSMVISVGGAHCHFWDFSQIPLALIVLIMLAPLWMVTAEIPWLRQSRLWIPATVGAVAVLIPIAVVVVTILLRDSTDLVG